MLSKPKRENRKKIILYLDQNFLSNIDRAYTDIKKKNDLKTYKDLGDLLNNLVKDGKVICPSSPYYYQESPLEHRKGRLGQAFNLSWDLTFRTDLEMRKYQIADAAADFLNCRENLPFSEWWEIPFGDNPDLPNASRGQGGLFVQITRDIKSLDKLNEKSKSEYLNWFSRVQKNVQGKRISFEECKKQELESIGIGVFVHPIQVAKEIIEKGGTPTQNQDCNFVNALEAESIFNNLKASCKSDKTLVDFVKSKEIMEIPLERIKAIQYSAILTNYVPYSNKESSHADININSMVIPYVDIFCTDAANKELIKQLSLDKEYKIEVYSMKETKNLLKKLEAL